MGIERRESGFYEWHDLRGGVPALGVESNRIDECLEQYRKGGFAGLFGCPSYGFDQTDLDFLARAPDAKWLWFWDVSLKNIDAIYNLNELDHVGINPKRPGIDFSRFPALRSGVNHWIKADTGISASTMTEYNLWRYNPRSKVFDGLEIPQRVERLEFCWANPPSLDGLPVMKKLKELQFHRCRNLCDLSALPRIAPNLEKLLTTTSSKVDATAGVLDHPKLKEALIDGNFVVGKGR